MDLRQKILAFAEEFSGQRPNGAEEADFLGAFGLAGDDANEFLEGFAARFGVDLSGLRWEFHYNADEPPGRFRRVLPVGRDGKVIPLHPITMDELTRAAQIGRWHFTYPEYGVRGSFLEVSWAPILVGILLVVLFLIGLANG